ncbi:MAG TPA: PAS domain S-box protein [Accumulibacter sp.]|uniref:PAS domain S-box protein n=1 Tax=Accumulibacter sp. TaxID=2053492 RepID=UPI002C453911|nr:PAS domain S-box protein [Accumulibacter sp.]HRF71951.1 PAS domain S-box protein [Accumulibacter sp.]
MSDASSPTSPGQQPSSTGGMRRWSVPPLLFSRYLAVVIVGLNLAVAAAVLYFFAESRRSEEHKSEAQGAALVRLIAKEVENQYGRIDLTLQIVAEEYAQQISHGRDEVENWLQRVAGWHPALALLRIADADGNVIYSPAEDRRSRVPIADRAYFIQLRDDPQAGLAISQPLTGRITRTPIIVLARRIALPDGRFNGIALASLRVEHLNKILIGMVAGAAADVGLIDSEFRWVAGRAVESDAAEGESGLLVAALRKAVEASPEQGFFAATKDGSGLLVAYARSAAFGFYVIVGQPRAAVLAAWRQHAWVGASGVALFAVLSTLLGLLLSRHWQQQAAATASLLERDEWIRQAQQVGGFGLFSYEVATDRFGVSESLYAIAGADAAYPHSWAGWLALVHPDDRQALDRAFRNVVAARHDVPGIEYRIVRPLDGSLRWVRSTAQLLAPDMAKPAVVGVVLDVTAQRRDEARLRQSEEELRAAFEQAAVGISFVAPDGSWLSVNDRLCQIVGYRKDELLRLRFQDITHADDLASDVAEVDRMLACEIGSYSKEKRYIRKDGGSVWVNITVALIWNEDRTPKHFVVIIEDIDARKSAERELGHTREMLRNFLDHLPGLAYIKDQSLRMLHVNRRCRDLLHRDAEQLIGKTSAEIFPGDRGEGVSARDRQVLDSGNSEIVERSYGDSRYQSIRFVIRQNDDPPLLGGITIDVTPRYKLEQRTVALLEINERGGTLPEKEFLAYALELAEKLTTSRIGFLHFVNDDQETIALSTWTAGALQSCSAMFDAHYPISQAGIWADCCRESRAVCFNDYAAHPARRGLPDGHAPLQRLISVPVLDEGAVRMIIGVGNKTGPYDDFDVTSVQLIGNDVWNVVRRGRAEADLARRLAEVTELKDQLEQAHLQLLQSEKMSAIGQLAAGVAHELNNPIGFVYSNLGTLAEYVDDLLAIDAAVDRVAQLPAQAGGSMFDEVRRLKAACDHPYIVEDLPKLIAESKEGLERVRQIVIDLKDFSRVGEAEWQWADLEQGLDSTINIVWNELKYKADVERHYAGLPPINCLASQLNQVFMNLLVNAAQAIETRGRIDIRTGSEEDAAGAVNAVWVEIEDTGRGMSPEVQKRLFEPFFTTKQIGQGTGLGLSIAFGIVEKHHGRIDFRSAVGRGTRFRITLPIDGSQSSSMSA